MTDIKKFQEVIGYHFHDEKLLRQALTHSSFANEKHLKKHSDNERLEFLGDAVLEIISSEFLYKEYPDKPEGELTKLRASIVCEPTLALCTKDIALGEYLLLGKGEDQTGGRGRKSILSDALPEIAPFSARSLDPLITYFSLQVTFSTTLPVVYSFNLGRTVLRS